MSNLPASEPASPSVAQLNRIVEGSLETLGNYCASSTLSSGLPGLPLLIRADDEVTVAYLVTRNSQGRGGIELTENERIAFPSDKLLDQDRLPLLVDDNIAASRRGFERIY